MIALPFVGCNIARKLAGKYVYMYSWMDGCMNVWMDGWMDGWVDGWIDGWIDGWMDGWMDGWIDGSNIYFRQIFSYKKIKYTYHAHSPWYNNELEAMKRKLRRFEKYIIKPIPNLTIIIVIQFANNIHNY